MTVTTEEEGGKIDLNTADDKLLRSLLESVGLSGDAADALFDKIADWRDPNDLRRLAGANSDDYRAAGRAYGPRNRPFESVDELREVMDMTPDLFAEIAPAVTVFSSRSSVDPAIAQSGALRALSQMMTGQSDALAAAPMRSDQPNGVDAVPTTAASGPLPGNAFTIRAEVHLNQNADYVRETVVRLTGDPRQPYWILRVKDAFAP